MTADGNTTVDDAELDRRLRDTFRTIMPLLDADVPSDSTDELDGAPPATLDSFARRRPKRPSVKILAIAAALLILAGTAVVFALNDRGERRVATASEPAPGDTRIVYSRFIDSGLSAARLVIADSDGGNPRELTRHYGGHVDRMARFSPDGKQIVFYREVNNGTFEIRMIGSDGQNEHLVDLGCVDPCLADKWPSWTPDGKHLIFQRTIRPEDRVNGTASALLFQADPDGRNVKRFSEPGIDGTFEDSRASFAPAGYVVFIRTRTADGLNAVFRMNRDATDVRQLSTWLPGHNPEAQVSSATSGPTRDLVVFTYLKTNPDASFIATVPATCRSDSECAAQTRLLTTTTNTLTATLSIGPVDPQWSPDGRRIVFLVVQVKVGSTDNADLKGGIWTMNADGGDRKLVADSPTLEMEPAWGPSATIAETTNASATTVPACPTPGDHGCLGPLAPGTYTTSLFSPPLTYTVPEGWGIYGDRPRSVLLIPPGGHQVGVDAGTSDYIGVYPGVQMQAADCSGPAADSGATPADMARWITEQPKLIATPPAPAKIGGLEGVVVTVTMVAGAENSCPVPGTGNMVPLLMGKPDSGLAHPVIPGLAMRLYLLTSEGGVLAVEVDDVHGGDHLDDYDSVVRSMQFKLRRESPLGGS